MTDVFNMADISTASPEVVMGLVAMVILMLDFIAPKGGRDWLGYLSILGVLATFTTLMGQRGATQLSSYAQCRVARTFLRVEGPGTGRYVSC